MLIKENRDNFWMLHWLDEFMVGHKGFICGGCFKNIFNNEKVKDLDIFFTSEEDWDEAVDYFDSMTPGYEEDEKRDEQYKFYYKEEVEDETGAVVEYDPFEIEPAESEIPKTHIEHRVMYDNKFFEHLYMKRLVVDNEIPFPMSTFDRMFKYAKYGYFPCKETKMKVIDSIRQLPEEQVKISESLYDGMD